MLQPKHPVNVQGKYKCKYIKSSTGNIEINDVDLKHFCAYDFFYVFYLNNFQHAKGRIKWHVVIFYAVVFCLFPVLFMIATYGIHTCKHQNTFMHKHKKII